MLGGEVLLQAFASFRRAAELGDRVGHRPWRRVVIGVGDASGAPRPGRLGPARTPAPARCRHRFLNLWLRFENRDFGSLNFHVFWRSKFNVLGHLEREHDVTPSLGGDKLRHVVRVQARWDADAWFLDRLRRTSAVGLEEVLAGHSLVTVT